MRFPWRVVWNEGDAWLCTNDPATHATPIIRLWRRRPRWIVHASLSVAIGTLLMFWGMHDVAARGSLNPQNDLVAGVMCWLIGWLGAVLAFINKDSGKP